MRILVVEDNLERIQWFRTEFDPHFVTVAMDAKTGIACVQEELVDLICLDHDLGGQVFADSHAQNTGYQVAKAIVNSINKDTPVIVHSWNIAGAKNICSILKQAVYKPFGTFKKKDVLV